jgi:hypothetical protein
LRRWALSLFVMFGHGLKSVTFVRESIHRGRHASIDLIRFQGLIEGIGQAAGTNNPTGSKGNTTPVFQRPPQGNLISGNLADGVLINGASTGIILSGNFIGTDELGTIALSNGGDGVAIANANNNSLIGCTLFQNPFVFYNVIAGNIGNGVSLTNANNATVQANFLGMGADNATSVPNVGNGLLVAGTSQATQVGGVIPLGNVISVHFKRWKPAAGSPQARRSHSTLGAARFCPMRAPPLT